MIPQVHPVTEPTTILILSEEQEAMSPLVWGVHSAHANSQWIELHQRSFLEPPSSDVFKGAPWKKEAILE